MRFSVILLSTLAFSPNLANSVTDISSVFCHADVIFLIYLYQRWVYPVDKKRVNEFGFAAEDVDQAASSSDTPAEKEDEKKTN